MGLDVKDKKKGTKIKEFLNFLFFVLKRRRPKKFPARKQKFNVDVLESVRFFFKQLEACQLGLWCRASTLVDPLF